MCSYLIGILKIFLDFRYITSLALLNDKELILVHTWPPYTDVSYQGRGKKLGWGETDQNTAFPVY